MCPYAGLSIKNIRVECSYIYVAFLNDDGDFIKTGVMMISVHVRDIEHKRKKKTQNR
jgi:hypothetical protein